jgi:hypothetical protein
MSTERRTRTRRRTAAAVGRAVALVAWASARPASAAAPNTPWPAAPNWQSYVTPGRLQPSPADGTFTTKPLTSGTARTNAVFGDPLVGTVKACYLMPN